jgi:hypothetical protein
MAFGVAEPWSRLRKNGSALFERNEFALTPKSANRAGNLKGQEATNMVLGPFAPQQRSRPSGRTKQQAPPPERNPVKTKKILTILVYSLFLLLQNSI